MAKALTLPWRLKRMSRMGPREVVARLRDEAVKAAWRRLKGKPVRGMETLNSSFSEIAVASLELDDQRLIDPITTFGERLLAGRLPLFGRETQLPQTERDWFVDPDSARIAPMRDYAFDIDARDPAVVGNHKFLLEPSRLQHVTVLAAAWFVTGREVFAQLAGRQIQAWCEANPFLSGVHWTSGIEVGIRLVTFAWTRRLLRGWGGVGDCFEKSRLFRTQIYRHQQYLASLGSHSSSANNHLIAELVGLFVGASAFPWFAESQGWRESAAHELPTEAMRQIFADGLDREQASEYHGFVLELLMVAAAEDMAAGRMPPPQLRECIARMADAWAAILDSGLRAPRQGDSDDAYGLMIDPPDRARRPMSLLAAAKPIVGAAAWWPEVAGDIRNRLFSALRRRMPAATEVGAGRPARRPNHFPDAGLVLLRDIEPRADELWCRCDGGPHGFLSIAGHAHADALSIELRHGGVDILADPGTYCYLADPEARRYFRSTLAHNTLGIGGKDQARSGGPFLWLNAPKSVLVEASGLDAGRIARWTARHYGYARQAVQAIHQRNVVMDRQDRWVLIEDRVEAAERVHVRLAFHLGPAVGASLRGDGADLAWLSGAGPQLARLSLPAALTWRAWRGSLDPMLGWYAPCFGERVPATSLIGEGTIDPEAVLQTTLTIEAR
jgi:uncharacterized heparinase superfamily protein